MNETPFYFLLSTDHTHKSTLGKELYYLIDNNYSSECSQQTTKDNTEKN